MSGTCIVCLGDLGEGSSNQLALPSASAKTSTSAPESTQVTTSAESRAPPDITNKEVELIAHLKPCEHNLHNDCLTPWVERANSCPICRAKFYTVELSNQVGGDVISAYAVQDRAQVAEFDPSMLLEEVDDVDDAGPCQICLEDDNEDILMYCDGCNRMYHTYCVDLIEVPLGCWFCENCRAQREATPRHPCPHRDGGSPPRIAERRTRGQRRRFGGQDQAMDESWTQVWQTVWDHLNLDLDFPDDEEVAATAIRRHRQRNESNRREHDAWELRSRIAELQGGDGNRFRDTEPSLLGHQPLSAARRAQNRGLRTRHHPGTPEQEPVENRLAWEAFDQARQEESQPTKSPKPHRRKRKSSSNSPAELQNDRTETRTKRSKVIQRPDADDSGGSSHLQRPITRRAASELPLPVEPSNTANESSGPSFLQSLLKEVEDSSTAPNLPRSRGSNRQSPLNASRPVSDNQSPRPSSPALSPSPSNHPSPRALSVTPTPTCPLRESPLGLSWRSQRNGHSGDFTPAWSSPEPPSNPPIGRKSRIPDGVDLGAQRLQPTSPPPSRPRSSEVSPTRQQLSFNTKSDVQKMVSAALKPYYRKKVISRAEYTTINRDISRKLYDQIGNFEALGVEGRAQWETVASDEVERTVSGLKLTSSADPVSPIKMVKVAT